MNQKFDYCRCHFGSCLAACASPVIGESFTQLFIISQQRRFPLRRKFFYLFATTKAHAAYELR